MAGLAALAGVGPQTAARLHALGITQPADLLTYVPRAYRDWRTPLAIATLVPGEAIVVGEIVNVVERAGKFPLLSVTLEDGTGSLVAKFFGRRHLFGRFVVGARLFVVGRVERRGLLSEMNVTAHRELRDDEPYVGEIVPIYAASKDLPSRAIRTVIAKNLGTLVAGYVDPLPPEIAAARELVDVDRAWRGIHAPHDPADVEAGRRRVIFAEFFLMALSAAVKRARREASGDAPALRIAQDFQAAFERRLPFAPTAAQRRVIAQIAHDLRRSAPMNRLVQGDVGSGKTLVAAAGVVLAHTAGFQSALMAPTELLAQQHAQKLAPLLAAFGITVDAVFSSLGARERRAAHERIADGTTGLAVGTHALLAESLAFANLGLAIVDEQHRFGVAQRAALRAKSERAVHVLMMTATPIPRTLAQTKFADLDISLIDELPPGRVPVMTFVLRASRKTLAYEFVRRTVARGQQAYIVAPAIEEGDGNLTSALAEAQVLAADVFMDLRVAVLHGKLAAREKESIMAAFNRGDIDILVATTVIEVGVDVPNANVMIILDAQRYGLAQLHQLRGRVGRGVAQAFCLLVAPDDATDLARLEILASTNDGFVIAEEDLRLRRAGRLAGTQQAGGGDETIGDLVNDFALYTAAKDAAERLLMEDPGLQSPSHRRLVGLIDDERAARASLVTA